MKERGGAGAVKRRRCAQRRGKGYPSPAPGQLGAHASTREDGDGGICRSSIANRQCLGWEVAGTWQNQVTQVREGNKRMGFPGGGRSALGRADNG